MNRTRIIELLNVENGIPESERIEYLSRLKLPYMKKGKSKCFYDQFNQGSGSELKGKFWSGISSSRLAFEMYSWLANEKGIDDIEFELKLVGVTSRGVPNMDAFIEINGEPIFIENKFTECYEQIINCAMLPGAYWKEVGDPEALTTDGKPIGSTLLSRYHSDQVAMDEFLSFIKNMKFELENIDSNEKPKTWMEYGQEIKHLYGLYFYLKQHTEYHNKRVRFFNVYYYLEDPINSAIKGFFLNGEKMMNSLLKQFNIAFTYKAITAQDVIADMPSRIKAYGLDSDVKDILKTKFLIK